MTRKKAWCLGFFGALIFYWSAATLWSRFDWSREWKLTFSSADAEAVVTRIEPNNHCTTYFEFEVAWERYRNSGPQCGVRVGDKLPVYYLPAEPTFSTLEKPGDDLAFMIVAPLLLSLVSGFVLMVRLGQSPGA